MSKIALGYSDSAGNFNFMVKHVDYKRKKVVDLTFQDLKAVVDISSGIDFLTEFAISDEFIALKNVTKNVPNTNSLLFEEVYQMVSN